VNSAVCTHGKLAKMRESLRSGRMLHESHSFKLRQLRSPLLLDQIQSKIDPFHLMSSNRYQITF
jgi:hypothetical protein